jgi:dTDP-glucose pyrophosphorylase
MQAVIPAAGEGTRMGSLTDDRPKPMVEVAGRPLLTHCFEQLSETVEAFVVVVGHRMDDVVAHYGDGFGGVPITYVHQREQEGLAHAVLQAEPHVEGEFVVLNADNVLRANLGEAIEVGRSPEVDGALLVERVDEETAMTTGVVETGPDGYVAGMVEKPGDPPSTLVATGCYVLPEEIFYACHLVQPSDRGEYELSDAVNLLAHAGLRIRPVQLEGWRVNVNTPVDVERAERLLAGE